jgi:hypothetical protein
VVLGGEQVNLFFKTTQIISQRSIQTRSQSGAIALCLVIAGVLLSGCTASRIKRDESRPRQFQTAVNANRYQRADGTWEGQDIPPSTQGKQIPFIKLHMRNGDVYVLNGWGVTTNNDSIVGVGQLLDANRIKRRDGLFRVPNDSIALIETNRIDNPASVGLAVVSGVSVIITIACLANPKACFGSCPTFYADDGDKMSLQAEGFSASIAPSLEATDIDALYTAKPKSRSFELKLTNEALETHVIRKADVLALHRPANGRVFQTPDGDFYEAKNIVPPVSAQAEEGDCLDKIRAFDTKERFSAADSANLDAKETITLVYPAGKNHNPALVLGCRQTLLTTFLIYQSFAYMGSKAVDMLAQLERSDPAMRNRIQQSGILLGKIDVLVSDANHEWKLAGTAGETGPIATDVWAVPLTVLPEGDSLRIQLRMTKGMWRLNYAALAELGSKMEPVRIKPDAVFRDGRKDSVATERLRENTKPLVTLSGDEYWIHYTLPEDYAQCDLFLESRGYYLEWIRDEWLKEEDLSRVAQLFMDTSGYLKDLAPKFKAVEPTMEKAFWGSRYVSH